MLAGVELGGTKCICTLGTGPDDVRAQVEMPTTTADVTLTAIKAVLDSWEFEALGVASFGPLELDRASPKFGSIVSTPKAGWSGADLTSLASGAPIAIDTDVNGAARFAERLSAGLAARGHDVHVLTPSVGYFNGGTFVEEIEGQKLTVHRPPAVRWFPHDWLRFVWPWRAKHYARKLLDEVDADVVHSQSHIILGRGLTRIARQRGIPVVATNHVMAENIIDFTTLPPFLDKYAIKLA